MVFMIVFGTHLKHIIYDYIALSNYQQTGT